ncbi:MAG: prephenate dehydrogenase [Halobacteriaceae archaeon]
MHLLVVGAGDVGRWFAGVAATDGPVTAVTFADVDGAVATAAADELAAAGGGPARDACRGLAVAELPPVHDGETSDDARDDTAGGTGEEPGDVVGRGAYDAVCVAVPLPAAGDAIAAHAPRASAAVVDVTGAMVDPLAAMAAAAPDRERASFHPLFAPEAAPGTVAVATDADGPAVAALRDALADAGNDLVAVGAAEHDDAMRTVQGRAHAAVLAFALAASEDDVPADLATPVYERLAGLVERVTGGNPRVYADIQDAFGGAGDVAAAAARLADADHDEFAALYAEARDAGGAGDAVGAGDREDDPHAGRER